MSGREAIIAGGALSALVDHPAPPGPPFYIPWDQPIPGQPGCCRVCGCTEDYACMVVTAADEDGDPLDDRPCGWADRERTLCDNPECLAKAGAEELLP